MKVLVNLTAPTMTTLDANNKLLPGINEIDAEAWKKFREDSIIQKKIELGIIVEETALEEAEENPNVTEEALIGLKFNMQRQMIKDCFNVELLNKWKETVKDKPSVVALIDKQIAVINEPLPERDRSKSRQLTDTGKELDHRELTANPSAQDD